MTDFVIRAKEMTVQELYDWCKENNLTDAKIKICIDGAITTGISQNDIVEYGKAFESHKPVSKYVLIEVQT